MAGSRRVRLTLAKVKEMLRRERRKNRRLREVIDGLRGEIAAGVFPAQYIGE